MTCQEFENLLHPFVDGEFDDAERREAEAHLIGCEACSRKVHTERHFKEVLRRCALDGADERLVHAPDALRARIAAGVRAEQHRQMWRTATAYASVAAVAVVIGTVAWTQWPREKERFILDAAKFHARPLPPEISGDGHDAVEAWFGGKLDHRVPVPYLRDASISGARISNVLDRRAAYISYQKPDATGKPRTIGLFVFGDEDNDVDARPLPSVELERRLGYNVALWRDGEIVYELVSDLDESDIRAMLEAPSAPALPPPPSALPQVEVRPASLQQ